MPSDQWGNWSSFRTFHILEAAEAYSGIATVSAQASVFTSGYGTIAGEGQPEINGVAQVSSSGFKTAAYDSEIIGESYILTSAYPMGPGFWSPSVSAGEQVYYNLQNLKPFTDYEVRVQSKSGPFSSEWSEAHQFKTKNRPAAVVEGSSHVSTSGVKNAVGLGDVSALTEINTGSFKSVSGPAEIGVTASVSVIGGLFVLATSEIEAIADLLTAGQKNALIDSSIEANGQLDSSGEKQTKTSSEIPAAGATASAGDKSARSAVSISSQGQIMTTGIAALLDLGTPQNVQAMGISLSEIQLSWDEVLSADGYEYRFREKVL